MIPRIKTSQNQSEKHCNVAQGAAVASSQVEVAVMEIVTAFILLWNISVLR